MTRAKLQDITDLIVTATNLHAMETNSAKDNAGLKPRFEGQIAATLSVCSYRGNYSRANWHAASGVVCSLSYG